MEAMEMIQILLRNNMRDLRKKMGWNQDDLAEKTGYSTGFIADIERGKSWVSPEAIKEIAKAFAVSPARLFQEQETVSDESIVLIQQIASLGPRELEILKENLDSLSKPLEKKSKKSIQA